MIQEHKKLSKTKGSPAFDSQQIKRANSISQGSKSLPKEMTHGSFGPFRHSSAGSSCNRGPWMGRSDEYNFSSSPMRPRNNTQCRAFTQCRRSSASDAAISLTLGCPGESWFEATTSLFWARNVIDLALPMAPSGGTSLSASFILPLLCLRFVTFLCR